MARQPTRNSAASYVAVRKGLLNSGPRRALSWLQSGGGVHVWANDNLRDVGAMMLA